MSDVPVSQLKEGDVVFLQHCPTVLLTVTSVSSTGEVTATGYDKQGCPFNVRVRAPALGTALPDKPGTGVRK